MDAPSILSEVQKILSARGAERDSHSGERSMATTVNIFNAVHTKKLSEADGWRFMLCLKLARSQQGTFRLDDYMDLVGYAALLAECAANAELTE